MIRLTLRHRLLFLTLLPSALIAIALVAYFTYSGIKTLEGELRAKGLATVRYLAPVSEYGIIAGQIESLHGLAQALGLNIPDEVAIRRAMLADREPR